MLLHNLQFAQKQKDLLNMGVKSHSVNNLHHHCKRYEVFLQRLERERGNLKNRTPSALPYY